MIATVATPTPVLVFHADVHHCYNVQNYPILVCNHGNWDIYRNDVGYCVSIPTPDAARVGCKATHFGDARYVRVVLGVDVFAA